MALEVETGNPHLVESRWARVDTAKPKREQARDMIRLTLILAIVIVVAMIVLAPDETAG
jgi:hypothetical protein